VRVHEKIYTDILKRKSLRLHRNRQPNLATKISFAKNNTNKNKEEKGRAQPWGTNLLWEAGQHPQTLKDEWAKEPE